jgi:hypothetical protein
MSEVPIAHVVNNNHYHHASIPGQQHAQLAPYGYDASYGQAGAPVVYGAPAMPPPVYGENIQAGQRNDSLSKD